MDSWTLFCSMVHQSLLYLITLAHKLASGGPFKLILTMLEHIPIIFYKYFLTFIASLVAQTVKASACSAGDPGFNPWPGFDPWVGKIPWRRKWQPNLVLLPGKFHGLRSLVGYSPWGRKESDTEWLHFTFIITNCFRNTCCAPALESAFCLSGPGSFEGEWY